MKPKSCLIAAAGVLAASAACAADLPVMAQDPGLTPTSSGTWLNNVYVHVGPGALIVDGAAKIYTPAGRYPGATIKVPPQVTAMAEVGYFLTPNWAVSSTFGIPPTATIDGAGSVSALGRLGSTTYGPVALTAHYHLANFGRFQPYIGGGPTYMIAFNSNDGALNDLQVRSAWGVLGQVGFDYLFTNRLGLFVDMKKAYLRTTAVGSLAGTPIRADVKLDPYVLSGGLTYRF